MGVAGGSIPADRLRGAADTIRFALDDDDVDDDDDDDDDESI